MRNEPVEPSRRPLLRSYSGFGGNKPMLTATATSKKSKTFKTLIPQTSYRITFTAGDGTAQTRHIAAKDVTHAISLFDGYFAYVSIDKIERLHICYTPETFCL
jgi:hypothetical protein